MTRAGQSLICVMAFLLPWSSYVDFPQYAFFPLLYVTYALAGLFVVDSARRGWRIPFELTLPLAVLAILRLASYTASFFLLPTEFREWSARGFLPDVYPVAALAVLHFVRSREMALKALNVFVLSATAWAGVMLLARVLPLFTTPALMGIAALRHPNAAVYALAAALFAAAWHRPRTIERRISGAAAFVLAAWLIFEGLPSFQMPAPSFWPPSVSSLSTDLVAYLICFWPLARVAAKVEVARRESEDKLLPAMFLTLLGLAALPAIRVVAMPGLNELLLVALAGAWALPERETVAPKRNWLPAAALAPLCCLIGLNLVRVNPENTMDPRNYAAMIPVTFAGEPGHIDWQVPILETIEANYPGETQTNFWLAHARLDRGQLYAAAFEYRESLWVNRARTGRHPPNRILPPPTDEQRRAFLDRLRDKSSAVPPSEHRGAFAMAILGEDRVEEVLYLMRRDIETVETPPPVDESAQAALAYTAAVYLDDLRAPNTYLKDWTARDLLALLIAWGAEVRPAPDFIEPESLPVALILMPGICEKLPPFLMSRDKNVAAYCVGDDEGMFISRHATATHLLEMPPPPKDGAPVVVIWK